MNDRAHFISDAWRRRWVRWLAAVVLLPLPLFLLVANVMLWTGAVEAIVTRDDRPTKLRLEHGFAWTLWPTRVHIHDAHLTIDAYGYELDLEIGEALVDIRLLSLFERRAHFQEIEAEGVRGRYRIKLDPKDARNPQIAAYPPIAGKPARRKPDSPKPIPEPGRAWTVDLDDVDAQFDALWVNAFAFEPGGRVQGGMHWTANGDFEIPTTTVRPEGATLWLGEHETVRALSGEGSITIDTCDLGEIEGAMIPSYMSFEFVGEGEFTDPSGLTLWWPDVRGMIAGEPGPMRIDVDLDHGVFGPGSRLQHETTRAEFGPAHARLVSAADLVLAIEADGRPSATVALSGARLMGDGDLVGEGEEIARTDAVRGFVFVSHGDMTRPWALEQTHVETEEIIVDDLQRVAGLAQAESWTFTRGSGKGRTTLDIGADEIPIARADFELERAVLVAGPVTVGATMQSGARVRRMPTGEIIVDELTARTSALSLTTPKGRSDGTWVRVSDTTLRHLDGVLRIDSHARIQDAKPAITHLTRLDPLVDAAPDLRRLEPITAHVKVLVGNDVVEVDVVDAEQLGLHVAALWRKRGAPWRLATWVHGLTAVGYTDSHAERTGKPFVMVGKQWYAERKRWVRGLGPKNDAAKNDAATPARTEAATP